MTYELHVTSASETPRHEIDAPYFYIGEKEENLPIFNPDGTALIEENGEQKTILFAPTHIYGLYHQSVNIIFVLRLDKQLLIVSSQRSPHIFPFPGAYSVSVGGHIKHGETAIDNAIQETDEELGLKLSGNRFIPVGNAHMGHQVFVKHWEYTPSQHHQPITITQFDPKGDHLLFSNLEDFPEKELIVDYVTSTPGSPLLTQAPIPEGLFLRNFNREYGFYYVVLLSSEEYESRIVNPEEVKCSTLIPWDNFFSFISHLNHIADAFYTLTHDENLRHDFTRKVESFKE
ncbi:MAG: NUDIX domain-containing protein [Leptolyngbyaceae bacterium]|nr:NUDIX domain-containing protein [Leptolyngbyaceae bacterium]